MNPTKFLTELKRRNVYRAAVAYGVVAWFLTQLTTQVFPFFEIPNSAVRFVVIALAVGFPIAMLLSWLYEFTPEGVVRTEDLGPAEARSAQRVTGRILDFIIIGVLLLVIAMLIVGRLPFYRQTVESTSQKSIAVLPFENLSEDKTNAYFAEGIQDEILTRLSKIADLKVISRTSTQHYKNAPENLVGGLALTNMGLGDKAVALALSEQAVAANPIEKDAIDGPASIEILARVAAQTGEPDRAIAALQKLLSMPNAGAFVPVPLTRALLRLDPMFDPLRNDPRFQKLAGDKAP